MTPTKMFDGDLYVLAADAVQMSENAYKNGQADAMLKTPTTAQPVPVKEPVAWFYRDNLGRPCSTTRKPLNPFKDMQPLYFD